MREATVGIDIGTTSVKAMAVDGDGEVLASVRVPHALTAGAGRLEHDAEAAWCSGVRTAFDRVGTGPDVLAVAVAAMVPSLTAVDTDGRPCGPGLLYGDERGSGGQGESPATSGEALGFLRWLATNVDAAAGFWPAQAVANHELCGRAAIDYATAFCASPLFDGQGWDDKVVRSAGAEPEQLPAIATDLGPIGRMGEAGPVVGPGTIDALAAQLVAGADEPGDVLVILGATLIAWLVVSDWVERPGLWTVPHTAPGTCAIGGASNAGGIFVDWAHGLVRGGSPPDDSGTVATPATDGTTAVDPHDVPVWLPYVRGERTPLHRPDLRASLTGLHLGHGPAALRRAAHEGSGFALRRILDLARGPSGATRGIENGKQGPGGPHVVEPRRIVAVGGGARSREWVAALADCTGLSVDVAAVPDATALGAAFVARCTAGLEPEPGEARRWARTGPTVEPDPAWASGCDERYERFMLLTDAALAEHAGLE